MWCAICQHPRSAFFCRDCCELKWQPHRLRVREKAERVRLLELELQRRLQIIAQAERKQAERRQRRARLQQLQLWCEEEKQRLQALRAHNRRRREEIQRRQEWLAVADSLLGSSARRQLRRLPAVLQLRRSVLHSLSSSVSRLQYERLSLLYSLYPLRRVSTSVCTLLELPVPDDLEVLPACAFSSSSFFSLSHSSTLSEEDVQTVSLSSALGYLLLLTHLSACYLRHHLPFPMQYGASFSSLQSPSAPPSSPSSFVLSAVSISFHPLPSLDSYRTALTLLGYNIVALCRLEGMGEGVRQWRLASNMMDLLQAVRLGLRDRRKEQLEKEKKDWDDKWRQREEKREKEEAASRRLQQGADDADGNKEERRDREQWWRQAGSHRVEDDRNSRHAVAAMAAVYDALSPVRPTLPSPSALLHTVSNGYTQPLQSPPAAFRDSHKQIMDFTPPPSSSHSPAPASYSYQAPQPFSYPAAAPPAAAAAAAVSGDKVAAGVEALKPIAVSNVNADDADWDLIELEQKDEWDD